MTHKNCENMEAQMMMATQFNEHIRRIIISGPIRDETAAMFLDQITALEYMDPCVPINIYINSPGGNVDSSLGILDSITTCSCPIRTVGIGNVASAAVLLLAAGDKGNRIIAPNCRVMVHQVSTMVGGNCSELDNEIQEVQRLQEIYNKILSKYTGQSVKKLQQDMAQNYYMSAQEAINYGIADKILPPRKVSNIIIPGPKPKQLRNNKSKKTK